MSFKDNHHQHAKVVLRIAAYIMLIISLSCTSSCNKFIEVDLPKNQVLSDNLFDDDVTATSAVLGIYSQMSSGAEISGFGFAGGVIPILTGMSSDELTYIRSDDSYKSFYANAIQSTNGDVYGNIWITAYQYIYQVNACMEGLNKSTKLSATIKKQLLGECELTRAFLYFNLVQLFEDVPLELTTDYRVNALLARTKTGDIYAQMIKDLTDAKSNLTVNYPTADNTRPNLYAAQALLARIYLYQKKWDLAVKESGAVIGSNAYQLLTDLNSVFVFNSKEAIWQLSLVDNTGTGDAKAFVPRRPIDLPGFLLSNQLKAAFEPNDKRLLNWSKTTVTTAGVSYTSPYKYKYSNGNSRGSLPLEAYVILRLSEQYLIRAEASAQLGDISTARSDLNTVRIRAGLNNTTAADQSTILDAIQKERMTELFCEWGHRWYDLKRSGKIDAVMSIATPLKGGTWKTTAQLFPIPYSQILLNSNLVQNPGYN